MRPAPYRCLRGDVFIVSIRTVVPNERLSAAHDFAFATAFEHGIKATAVEMIGQLLFGPRPIRNRRKEVVADRGNITLTSGLNTRPTDDQRNADAPFPDASLAFGQWNVIRNHPRVNHFLNLRKILSRSLGFVAMVLRAGAIAL